jgi:4-hydroxybenzoyl-CoA thioesterase
MNKPLTAQQNLYRQPRKVRFSHCDPAGMVFFPRYLVQLNDLVEDWFDEALGINYAEFITTRKFGLPTVKLECAFLSPGVFGSEIEWQLSVERIGNSSIGLMVRGVDGDALRFELHSVLVATAVHQGGSVALPEDLRAALLRFSGSLPAAVDPTQAAKGAQLAHSMEH